MYKRFHRRGPRLHCLASTGRCICIHACNDVKTSNRQRCTKRSSWYAECYRLDNKILNSYIFESDGDLGIPNSTKVD